MSLPFVLVPRDLGDRAAGPSRDGGVLYLNPDADRDDLLVAVEEAARYLRTGDPGLARRVRPCEPSGVPDERAAPRSPERRPARRPPRTPRRAVRRAPVPDPRQPAGGRRASADVVFLNAVAALALLHAVVDRLLAARWSTIRDALAADVRRAPEVAAACGLDGVEVAAGLRSWAEGQVRYGLMKEWEYGIVDLMARSVGGER